MQQAPKRVLGSVSILVLGLSLVAGCGPSTDDTAVLAQAVPVHQRSMELATGGFSFQPTALWNTGYCAELRVTNSTGVALNGWTVGFELASGMTITSLWNGQWSAQGQLQTVRDADWNKSVPAGGTLSFGFCGAHSGTVSSPLRCTLNGQPCGNESSPPPADTQAPSQVTGLKLVSNSSVSVDLTWQASTDNVGVSGYEVFLNGGSSSVATTTGMSVSVTGLSASTTYTFTARARDAAGNRSIASAPLTVTTKAVEPSTSTFQPTAIWNTGYCAELRVTNGTGVALNGWTVGFELASGMTVTSLWNGQWSAQGQLQTVGSLDWNKSVPAGGTLSFGFCGAHTGTVSSPLRCTLNGQSCGGQGSPPADTQAPSQVTGLSLVSSSSVSVDLTWQASTDNVGVSGYEVFLNDGSSSVATTTGTSVSVTGLSPSTTYTFTVKARDAAGNRSVASAPLTVATKASNSGARKLIGYYPRWGVYERAFYPKNLDTNGMAARLTHINYAFGNVMNGRCGIFPAPNGDAWADYQMGFTAANSVDGVADSWDQPLRGNFNQLKKLKARYPHLKVLISLGGWTWSGGFSDAVATPESRRAFVQSCIDLYIRGNLPEGPAGAAAGIFDGIDIDWEYPAADGQQPGRPEDTENFTAVLAEFRRQLDAVRPGLLLTIATAATPWVYSKIQLDRVPAYLDFISIMAYDMHGGWDSTTNFHAPLYPQLADPARWLHLSTDEAVAGHLAAGVPASKLVVGVPFYGRGWQGTQPGPARDGLYQPTTGPARGNWDTSSTGNTGMFDYHYIKSTLEPAQGYVKYRHPEARVPYLYNPSTGLWVSYDDPTSLEVKADYINSRGLGGVMIWELSADDAQASLITALKNRLGP